MLDPGHVGGSAAWTDGVRGVLAMAWKPGGDAGERVLTITKANYGPARLTCDLDAIRHETGAIVGFQHTHDTHGQKIGGNSDDTEKTPYDL